MPSPEFERELRAMGIENEGERACGKCGRAVEKWGKFTFNLANHATDPLVLHLQTCGQVEDEGANGGLPPVPTQEMRVAERGE